MYGTRYFTENLSVILAVHYFFLAVQVNISMQW